LITQSNSGRYPNSIAATAQTRAIIDTLVVATKNALARSALEDRVGFWLSMAGSIEDMSTSHRARAGLALHGVGTGSPEDAIDVSAVGQSIGTSISVR
jgi:hypothetical protein